MDRVYASGARYFVLFNVTPLQLTALYANTSEGGETPSEYWPTKPDNLTDISERMTEFTTTLNTVFEYKTPVEVLLNNRYPGAKVALFDVNQIVSRKSLVHAKARVDVDSSSTSITTLLPISTAPHRFK